MHKKITILALCALSVSALKAGPRFPLSMQEKPAAHKVPDSLKKESSFLICEEKRAEYQVQNGTLVLYKSVHRIAHLNDEKGVEAFNTVNVPLYNGRDFLHLQARTILPDGKIYEASKDKFKITKNEKGYNEYRYAYEGVEKGCEVEFWMEQSVPVNFFGTEAFQYGIPVAEANFMLITPKQYIFETKGYNSFPTAKDSVTDDYRFYKAVQHNIPGLKSEIYANEEANNQWIAYRLSYNAASDNIRRLTWPDMVKNLHASYLTFSKKEEKAVAGYLESIGVSEDQDALTKIKKIEDALKTNITISEDVDPDKSSDFSAIISKKVTTEAAFVRFFAACLHGAGVPFELGLTANRYQAMVDDKFELYTVLNDHLFYFPKYNSYLSPVSVSYRYPFYPYQYATNKGIFCKVTTLGEMESALSDVRTIPALSTASSHHNTTADVSFNTEMEPVVDINISLLGYSATGLREIFMWSPKEKEKEVVQGLAEIATKPEDMESYTVQNKDFSGYSDNKPLLIQTKVHASQLLEKAGNKYLFHVGDIIGRQAEMYNDEHRMLPLEIEYCHTLERNIVIHIPDGYKVVNPEASKIKTLYNNTSGQEIAGFESAYTMNGNTLTIHITELYGEINYPLSGYESFRKVINAASDFNKVVLVMEKI